MNREYIESIFVSPPVMYSERLKFRPVVLKDTSDMFEYSCDPEVTKYLTWEPHPSIQFTKRYIKSIERSYKEGRFYDWALELRATGKMIGTCGFTSFSYVDSVCEIGYVINPRYRGYSIAPEAASKVIKFAFDKLGAKTVFARCIPENFASRRVMQKCGMEYKCSIERGAVKQNRFVTVARFEISRDKYLERWQTTV